MFLRESLKGKDILTKTIKTTCTGDFVIARMQVVHGAMTITPPLFDNHHVSDSYVTCISKRPDSFDTEFFGHMATLPWMWNVALLSSHGVSIEKMTFDLKTFFKKKVRVPSEIAEQQAIGRFLNLVRTDLDALQLLGDQLQTQKRGLMQQLLTGKKRVKV
jgi:type I restriction enzyme S subunit